jgi:hypothetical protein
MRTRKIIFLALFSILATDIVHCEEDERKFYTFLAKGDQALSKKLENAIIHILNKPKKHGLHFF